MWFSLSLLVDLFLESFGYGNKGRELREEIERLLEKASHLPEKTLLLDRDRFARRLFRIYWTAGMGTLGAVYICVRFIEGIIGPHTPPLPFLTEMLTGMGRNLNELLLNIVLSYIAGLPILCVASWSRRHLSRGILLGVTEENFRNRAHYTKFVFTGTMLIAFALYGYMLHNLQDIELGLLVFPPLLGFFTYLWYVFSVFLAKSGGAGPNEKE